MGHWDGGDYFDYFPRTRPRRVKGGIKARSRRGAFGENWWTKRWLDVLESFDIGARLSRGRGYARRGQVLWIDVRKGEVAAEVQGSRSRPYRVKISCKTLGRAEWRKLAGLVAQRPLIAARLLAGEMSRRIMEVFEEAGLSVFPEARGDLKTSCSCPDWSNPCKHIAAVYYLLGEEFDRDPFLLFRLRGIERGEFIELVGRRVAGGDPVAPESAGDGAERGNATSPARRRAAAGTADSAATTPAALPADPASFWNAPSATATTASAFDSGGEARVPTVPATLPRRLGSFPFWQGDEDFLGALEDIYRAASALGLEVFLGERES